MIRLIALLLLLASNAYAIQADYTHFEINGKDYAVPIPNKETRSDFYMLHKAIKGDKVAREMLLAGNDEKYFYIGDIGANRWLVLTKKGQRVIEHG